jgi:transmembrane sensor
MPDPLKYYQMLLKQYLNNNCTPQQAEEILEFLQQDVSGKIVLQQLQNEFNKAIEENKTIPPEVSRQVRDRLMHLINPARVIPFYRKLFFWRIAAAVIIGFCAASYFLFFDKSDQKSSVTSTAARSLQHDIAPGGNKATLTLADGSSIILDSAQNGSLAQQGNTRVLKLNTGQLAYNVNDPHNNEILYNTLTTPRGGQYQLTLADGSKVWLNAASSITFPTAFSGKERKVEVTGEVYFEVVKNTSMPFVVKKINDNTLVQVLGTHFNINAYDDEPAIKITLLEGSVNVLKGNAHTMLKPGEQAIVSSKAMNVVNDVELDEVMAWKNGRFYFEEEDIRTIMRQVEKWYNVDVKYEADIKYSFVAEISRDVNVSKLLKLMELTELVHFKIEGNTITVTK